MKSRILFTAVLCLIAQTALAVDIVVIVNKDNDFHLDKDMIAAYFTGEAKRWIGGLPVSLIELPANSPETAAFTKQILGMNAHDAKALQTQNVLSGKAIGPREVTSDDEVKKAVSSSRIAIGYIKASSIDDSVKVVPIN